LGDEKTADEIVNVVLKDLDYYQQSHGGVTFSGGEALNQWPFIESVAKKLKEHGLHLTLDISGYDPARYLNYTTDLIDLYLLDLKTSSDMVYQKYIRQILDPKQTLNTLKKASRPVILRCPLIPDINDDPGYFDLLANLVDEYDNIIETNLLPYHKLRKNQNFKLYNDRQFFTEPDSTRKEIWVKEIRDRKIRNVWMENKEISL
jgi:pyruvate formate lyase activating enzyme